MMMMMMMKMPSVSPMYLFFPLKTMDVDIVS